MRRIPVLFVLVFVLILVLVAGCNRGSHPSLVGNPAPDFTVQDADRKVTLHDLRGKIVVLNFWATWCPPCVEETPALIQLNQRITGRNGMVLGVSVDEDQSAYLKFIQDHGINYLTYRDPSKKSAQEYGTVMYPETYVIDRKGKIARKIIGPQDWNSPEMLAYFDSLLGQN